MRPMAPFLVNYRPTKAKVEIKVNINGKTCVVGIILDSITSKIRLTWNLIVVVTRRKRVTYWGI
jgi:hypothetical protein